MAPLLLHYARRSREGSTLVELLIAISLFTIFIAVTVGGFIQALSNQRVVLKLMTATDNLSLSIEQMMREVRVGTNFEATGCTAPNSCTQLAFDRADEELGTNVQKHITYALVTDAATGYGYIRRAISNIDGSGELSDRITADTIDISYLGIRLSQERSLRPYLITMRVGVTAHDKALSVTNYIQSTISSRLFAE